MPAERSHPGTAAGLDRDDPLRDFRDRFVTSPGDPIYLDGNSLGRLPGDTLERLRAVVQDGWGTRLIRGWAEGWMELPQRLGDRIGTELLAAAPGQIAVADSTTVCIYKLASAAIAARPGRREIVTDRDNFPTDRYVLESVAAQHDLVIRWIEADPATGPEPGDVAAVTGPDTALVALSHVAYKSAFVLDMSAITPRLGATLVSGRQLMEARDSAVTDYLTGLPNSRSLYLHLDGELARSHRRGHPVGVLLCDLDGFKRVNDEHGHLEGNRVLKAIAGALKQCCRSYDYVARMGGDEFVIVLPEVKGEELQENVERFRTAVEMAGIEVGYAGLSVSIGAVAFSDESGIDDADLILAEADRRMYANKKRRKTPRPVEISRGARPLRKVEQAENDSIPGLAVQTRVC